VATGNRSTDLSDWRHGKSNTLSGDARPANMIDAGRHTSASPGAGVLIHAGPSACRQQQRARTWGRRKSQTEPRDKAPGAKGRAAPSSGQGIGSGPRDRLASGRSAWSRAARIQRRPQGPHSGPRPPVRGAAPDAGAAVAAGKRRGQTRQSGGSGPRAAKSHPSMCNPPPSCSERPERKCQRSRARGAKAGGGADAQGRQKARAARDSHGTCHRGRTWPVGRRSRGRRADGEKSDGGRQGG